MSKPPRFDATALIDALGDRARRVRQIGEVAQALLDGRLPSRNAAIYCGGALMSWLAEGGSLERDYLKLVKPKSHRTPSAIWREMNHHQDEDSELGAADTLDHPHPKGSK